MPSRSVICAHLCSWPAKAAIIWRMRNSNPGARLAVDAAPAVREVDVELPVRNLWMIGIEAAFKCWDDDDRLADSGRNDILQRRRAGVHGRPLRHVAPV